MNHGFIYRDRIHQESAGLTAIEYLASRYTHSSIATWQDRFDAGEVQLNNSPITGDTPLALHDELAWHRPPWEEPAAPLDFAILARDEHLLAVAKPSGLPTLPGGGFLENTLLHRVRAHYPDATPAHRLGRGTSGVLLFALTESARASCARAFKSNAVTKRYLALAEGVPTHPTWTETTRIGPVHHPLLGTLIAANPQGKHATSHIRVLEQHSNSFIAEVRIETGRAHQIRIHMAASGHPLVGDPLYIAGGVPKPDCTSLPGDLGYTLHAQELSLLHPATRSHWTVRCPAPPALHCTPT